MNRKHYVQAAKDVYNLADRAKAHTVGYWMADFFESVSPLNKNGNRTFDRHRFLEACGVFEAAK